MAKPLVFCAHLARAVRLGLKTITWKPLPVADLERRAKGFTSDLRPYRAGDVVQLDEPWGYLGGTVTYQSSFAHENRHVDFKTPQGFKERFGTRSERALTILSCDLRRLDTIDEADAKLAGTLPADGSTYLAEFERQWRSAYRGLQSWEAKPLCWRIAFTLNPT